MEGSALLEDLWMIVAGRPVSAAAIIESWSCRSGRSVSRWGGCRTLDEWRTDFLAEEEAMIAGYASEKLASAVGYMACSNETLQKRLEVAYMEFHSLIPADFSDELGEKYLEVACQLTRKGSVPATAAAMTDQEAFGIAESIVDLFFAVVGVKKAGPVFNTASFL